MNQSQLQKSITMRFEISSTRQTKKSYSIPDIVAKANTGRLLCNCPSSDPGKINLDVYAHEPNCRIRKRLQTKRYTVDTSATPEKFVDGYALGVAV